MLAAAPIVTEILHIASEPSTAELGTVPDATSDDFDFVELWNPSEIESIDLTGFKLSGSAEFTFPEQALAPREFMLVVANQAAFEARYGSALPVVGSFESGSLGSLSEIVLRDDLNETLLEFTVGGHSLWPTVEQLTGASLELVDTATPSNRYSSPSSWSPSVNVIGTPGEASINAAGVWINEVQVSTDEASIELFNSNDTPIDISGWFVSDSAANLSKYQIPAETTVEAESFFTLSETDFNPDPDNALPEHFALAGSGELWLTRFTEDARLVEDVAEFSSMKVTESFGKTPSGRMFPNSDVTIGTPNSSFRIGPIVISEIHFHSDAPSEADLLVEPSLTKSDLGFVEIFNSSDEPVDLSEWRLGGDIEFTFTEGTIIESNEVAILTSFDAGDSENENRLMAFEGHHGLNPESYRVLGNYQNELREDYGIVQLYRGVPLPTEEGEDPSVDLLLEDQIIYEDVDWPEADGNGEALARLQVDLLGGSTDAWQSVTPTPGSSTLVPEPLELLPDLILWDNPLVGVNYLEYLEPHASTGRELLRFSTGVANVGDGPLIVHGGDIIDGTQTVDQFILREDGSQVARDAGEFVFHPGHGHVHFDGYAEYNLRVVLPDEGVGPLVATSDKVSFCLLDFSVFDSSLANSPDMPQFDSCESQTQGVSVGWIDVYSADLPDQWIDVEDVPPGEYWFETVVDPFDRIRESDETNNVFRTKIVLGVPRYEADVFDTAAGLSQSLGVGDKYFENLSIHQPGDIDGFTWTATKDGQLNVDLEFDATQGNVDLYVASGSDSIGEFSVDEFGKHVVTDVIAGETYRVIAKHLGGYTIPNYTLSIDGPDISPDELEPNDDFASATILDGGDQQLTELTIDESGGSDFFTWTATETGLMHVDARYAAAEGRLNLVVFDSDHSELVRSSGSSPLINEFVVVEGQTYFLQIQADPGDFSAGYDLNLDFLEIQEDAFEPNDHNFTPVDLGAGSLSLHNMTIHTPFNRDFYLWRPIARGTSTASLIFEHDAGDLDLILWVNGESVGFWTSTTDNEVITSFVDPDNQYMFEVVGKNGDTNPRYSLHLESPSAPRITSVRVGGSGRASGDFALFGDDTTTSNIPWSQFDRIRLGFSSDVLIAEDTWELFDGDGVLIEDVEFVYDTVSSTATWVLPAPVDADSITLRVFDSIVDENGNSLDGEWADGQSLPSGDGLPEGNFELVFTILAGDYVTDGILDVLDIDRLALAIREQQDAVFDLDGDGEVSGSDRQHLLNLMGVRAGDATLDGVFDSKDLITVFQFGEYDDSERLNSTWAEGDWNGDGDFDSGDLIVAFQAGYDELNAVEARIAANVRAARSDQYEHQRSTLEKAVVEMPSEPGNRRRIILDAAEFPPESTRVSLTDIVFESLDVSSDVDNRDDDNRDDERFE